MASYVPSKFESTIRSKIQHYNAKKYWSRRERVQNFSGGLLNKIICTYYLYYLKKCDAFNNASLGTFLGRGAKFNSVPNFPHGLYGIIISGEAVLGKNCTIFHQVTIGTNGKGVPKIGDNVTIGTGAKILGPITIGNNVKIGANAVVTQDIPDNCIVVCERPKIILKEKN